MRFLFPIKELSMEHNKDLTPFAQELRKNMTKEEQKLWYQFLKNHPVQFITPPTLKTALPFL